MSKMSFSRNTGNGANLNGTPAKRPAVHASHLKIAAIVTMALDHFAVAIFACCVLPLISDVTNAYSNGTYYILRTIGRMAFPIFCFFIVEGLQHTRSVKKYAVRLLIFGIVSEIPFNMAITGKYFDADYQNVYFTLCIGLVAIAVIDWLLSPKKPAVNGKDAPERAALSRPFRLLLAAAALILGMAAAWKLNTDYGALGVLVITAMYFLRRFRLGVIAVGILLMMTEMPSVWLLIPIAAFTLLLLLYDGRRGMSLKYFFYAFYPAHLLIFGLIRILWAGTASG